MQFLRIALLLSCVVVHGMRAMGDEHVWGIVEENEVNKKRSESLYDEVAFDANLERLAKNKKTFFESPQQFIDALKCEIWYKSNDEKKDEPVYVGVGQIDNWHEDIYAHNFHELKSGDRFYSDMGIEQIAISKKNPPQSPNDVRYFIVRNAKKAHPRYANEQIDPKVFLSVKKHGDQLDVYPQVGQAKIGGIPVVPGLLAQKIRNTIPYMEGSIGVTKSGLSTLGIVKNDELIELPYLWCEDSSEEEREQNIKDTFTRLRKLQNVYKQLDDVKNLKMRFNILKRRVEEQSRNKYLYSDDMRAISAIVLKYLNSQQLNDIVDPIINKETALESQRIADIENLLEMRDKEYEKWLGIDDKQTEDEKQFNDELLKLLERSSCVLDNPQEDNSDIEKQLQDEIQALKEKYNII